MVYIDSEFKCHVTNPDGVFKEIKTDFFNDKCDTFIEGYRFIPSGETWTRDDGVIFHGEMISPFKPYDDLASAQHKYERELLAEYRTEMAVLDAALLDAQYNILVGGL